MSSRPEIDDCHDVGKDYELLDSSRSRQRSDTILEKIARIRRELGKGEEVYTKEEISRLQSMLDEYLFLLERLQY